MNCEDCDTKKLNSDMDHVLKNAEHFLKDLKGQRRTKGMVKKDVQHLKVHVQKLMDHLNCLEENVR